MNQKQLEELQVTQSTGLVDRTTYILQEVDVLKRFQEYYSINVILSILHRSLDVNERNIDITRKKKKGYNVAKS